MPSLLKPLRRLSPSKVRHFLKYRRNEIRPKQKTIEQWRAKQYICTPEISFVIQSHNRSAAVVDIIRQLRFVDRAEIIVIDDGSEPLHLPVLSAALTRPNDFLLRANDLYDVITYSRAIHLARGTFVVLLSDDDSFQDLSWIDRGLGLMRAAEKMAILGGRNGLSVRPYDRTPDGAPGPYTAAGEITGRANCYKLDHHGTLGNTATEFKFVQHVNLAPMWIRRELFVRELVQFDQQFAPTVWHEAELCLRAWRLGLKVGWYPAGLKWSYYGKGGARIWNSQLVEQQDRENARLIYDRYANVLEEIDHQVAAANAELAMRRSAGW